MDIQTLNNEECREVLKQQRTGRIACSIDNQPYIVPLNFVFDEQEYLYAFSVVGKKIKWMRKNPLVCIEVDDIKNQSEWKTLIIYGRYEELPDLPEFQDDRILAHQILAKHPMWWQPAFVAGTHKKKSVKKTVYFRIHIEKVTGLKASKKNIDVYKEVYPEVKRLEDIQKNNVWGLW